MFVCCLFVFDMKSLSLNIYFISKTENTQTNKQTHTQKYVLSCCATKNGAVFILQISQQASIGFSNRFRAGIFTKQNVFLKQINSYSCCVIVTSKPQNLCKALSTGPRRVMIAPKWRLVGLVTQTVKTAFIVIVFKV